MDTTPSPDLVPDTTTDGLADSGTAGQAPAFPNDGGCHGHGPRDAAGTPGSGTQTGPGSGTQTTPNAGIGAPSGVTGPGHAATGGS